jgi:hypothetical protein
MMATPPTAPRRPGGLTMLEPKWPHLRTPDGKLVPVPGCPADLSDATAADLDVLGELVARLGADRVRAMLDRLQSPA